MALAKIPAFEFDDNRVGGNGVPVLIAEGITLWVRRAGGGNREFARVYAEEMGPMQRLMADGTSVSNDVAANILRRVYARAVVVSWDGIRDDQGREVPYSVDACVELFTSYPDILMIVRREADRLSNFRAHDVRVASGN